MEFVRRNASQVTNCSAPGCIYLLYVMAMAMEHTVRTPLVNIGSQETDCGV